MTTVAIIIGLCVGGSLLFLILFFLWLYMLAEGFKR